MIGNNNYEHRYDPKSTVNWACFTFLTPVLKQLIFRLEVYKSVAKNGK